MIGYNLRFLPSLKYFHDYDFFESVGKILSIHIVVGKYLPNWRSGIDYRKTVSAKSELGGGVLLELSHEIDYLIWIFGEIESVNALVSKQSDLEINSEDNAYIHLIFKPDQNGYKKIASLNMDFIRHDSTRTCTVIGSRTSLQWNGYKGTVSRFDSSNNIWEIIYKDEVDKNYSYIEELKHFISCVNSNSKPYITGYDGQSVIQVIEAIKLSSNKKCRIAV